ncbi:hypothetical protein B4110_1200 [Parageobacillus toebii]|uniref:Stage V sporulation protein M n=1 Tax=Parageobacillus toebii TaxID=153151 RepID=A0A150MYZ4_9BACL|nr:hypothetical protein B4110_1200 [Parageobacillus toebii]
MMKEARYDGCEEGIEMKFYTIKLPKFLGGIVRAMLNSFKKG